MANNGQLLFNSYGYTSVQGAIKKNVEEGIFLVYEDKFKRLRYILNKRYSGENYINKVSCENSVKSIKRFALTAFLTPYENY